MTRGTGNWGAEASLREVSASAQGSSASSQPGYGDRFTDGGGGDTETTGLLGAGTHGSGSGGEHDAGANDTWIGMEDFKGFPWWKTPSVVWLLIPYALFTLAFGGSVVPKLNLIIDLICDRYFADRSSKDPSFVFTPVLLGGDNPECRHDKDVLQKVATFTLIVSVLTGLLSSLTAPKIGALSDLYGRKRLLVVCSFGGIASEIIIILAAKFPATIHYNWLILGGFFDGLLGSFTAGSVLIHSYTSDCTPPSQRNVAIGYLHACLFTGLAFGPLLAGYFVEWMGSLLSIFYVTLGCHLFFIFFVACVVPESLSKKKQVLAREKYALQKQHTGSTPRWEAVLAALPFGKRLVDVIRFFETSNPLAPLAILFPKGPENKGLRRNLIALALIDTTILGTAMAAGGVTLLYTQDMFGWRNLESSQFVSLVSMVRVLVLLGIFPIFNYFFRIRPEAKRRRESGVALTEKNAGADKLDIWTLRIALLSDVIGLTGYIFVRTSPLFVACAVITAFGGLGSATIQASLSKHVPAERVGQLLGAIGLLHALSRVVCPILLNGVYYATVKVYPQAFFVLLSVIFGVCLGASWLVKPGVFMEESYESVPSSPTEEEDVRAADARDILEDEEVLPVMT